MQAGRPALRVRLEILQRLRRQQVQPALLRKLHEFRMVECQIFEAELQHFADELQKADVQAQPSARQKHEMQVARSLVDAVLQVCQPRLEIDQMHVVDYQHHRAIAAGNFRVHRFQHLPCGEHAGSAEGEHFAHCRREAGDFAANQIHQSLGRRHRMVERDVRHVRRLGITAQRPQPKCRHGRFPESGRRCHQYQAMTLPVRQRLQQALAWDQGAVERCEPRHDV